jgi:hypothetical protein
VNAVTELEVETEIPAHTRVGEANGVGIDITV